MSRLIETDKDVAAIVGRLLRWGVLTACFVAIVGGVMFLMAHSSEVSDFTEFRGAPAYLRSPEGIYRALLSFDARAIIQAGVIILIATPILRVALSIFAFAMERDYLYVLITLVVLIIISIGMFGGLAG